MKAEDQTVWVGLSKYGHVVTVYPDQDTALDRITRTDSLYTCEMVNWKPVQAQLKAL